MKALSDKRVLPEQVLQRIIVVLGNILIHIAVDQRESLKQKSFGSIDGYKENDGVLQLATFREMV